eukprot:scaffold318566_cov19-Tisochrysis_lutea.AAC.1
MADVGIWGSRLLDGNTWTQTHCTPRMQQCTIPPKQQMGHIHDLCAEMCVIASVVQFRFNS